MELFGEHWNESVAMELPCTCILFTSQLEFSAGVFSGFVFGCSCSFWGRGLSLAPCMSVYFGKFILNKIACKFDRMEKSLSLLYVKIHVDNTCWYLLPPTKYLKICFILPNKGYKIIWLKRICVNIWLIKPYDKTCVFGVDCGKPANLLCGKSVLYISHMIISNFPRVILGMFLNAQLWYDRTLVLMPWPHNEIYS